MTTTADPQSATTDLTTVHDPAELGFDPARLQRIDAVLGRYVDDGLLPGWQLAITRHGRLAHHRSVGRCDVEAALDIADDTIFRIYSMTKVVTAVTALALWEQGAFDLNDPVARFIPSFGEQRVWRGGSTTRPQTEPVTEPMRIWHLFTHTSGLTYGFLNAHPVDALYRQAGLDLQVGDDLDLAALCDRLAGLPLLFQPGTEWNYGMSTDVLGRVVEVAAGRPFAEVMQDVVLDPLGMTDTCWFVGPDRADRLAALYVPTPGTGLALRWDPLGTAATRAPSATLGGGGLCSTTADYLRFAAMLARRGELDGVRVLRRRRSTTWRPTTSRVAPISSTSEGGCSARPRSTVSASVSASAWRSTRCGPRCPTASASSDGAARRAPPSASIPCSTRRWCS